jgi:hypothetical protein
MGRSSQVVAPIGGPRKRERITLRLDQRSYTRGVQSRQHETLLEHVQNLRPVTAVRSTLLASSIGALRSRGHFEAYLARLDPAYRDAVLAENRPAWFPIAVAVAHYDACDRLELSVEEIQLMGWSVGARIETTFLHALAKGAQALGVTPWKLLGNFERLWARVLQNGSVSVVRTGQKDGFVEVRGVPLARFQYFRVAFAGVVSRAIEFGGGRAVRASVNGFDGDRGEISVVASWV